jgi:hypothetical protein
MLQTVDATTVRGTTPMQATTEAPKRRLDPLTTSVSAFADFSAGLMVIAELAPERLTCSQVIFFLLTGTADIAGRDPTYTDIKEAVGDKINKSLNTTYRIFLEPSRLYPNGLGWLKQEPNPDDNRVKFLRLTKKGKDVMRQTLEALRGE